MMKNGFLVLLFSILFSVAAQASEWVVQRATKNVSVSANGTTWHGVKAGDAVPNAYWVRTGPRGRVILAKGSERIMYRANTIAAISVSQPKGKKTKVTQTRGSILLSVKKRRAQHTSVVTPHLAAVVKGTVFEVSVEGNRSDVRVDKGLVEVSDGDRSVNVSPGQVARVNITRKGIDVAPTSETSLTANGTVGLALAELKSGGKAGRNAGGNGNSNAGGNGNSNAGGNGNSGRN